MNWLGFRLLVSSTCSWLSVTADLCWRHHYIIPQSHLVWIKLKSSESFTSRASSKCLTSIDKNSTSPWALTKNNKDDFYSGGFKIKLLLSEDTAATSLWLNRKKRSSWRTDNIHQLFEFSSRSDLPEDFITSAQQQKTNRWGLCKHFYEVLKHWIIRICPPPIGTKASITQQTLTSSVLQLLWKHTQTGNSNKLKEHMKKLNNGSRRDDYQSSCMS